MTTGIVSGLGRSLSAKNKTNPEKVDYLFALIYNGEGNLRNLSVRSIARQMFFTWGLFSGNVKIGDSYVEYTCLLC
jgi:hypothetical protein